MTNPIPKLRPHLLLTAVLAISLTWIAATNDQSMTGDPGDSVMHYLYARYAFSHPGLFLDHWAKPLFVLLTAPFAQAGFIGVEIFNIICACLTALATYHVATSLKMKWAPAAFLLFFFAPLWFRLIFSGLTEYLFALMLVLGILLQLKNKTAAALILNSFLPLVRSEGLIVCGMFGLFHLLHRNFRMLPLLLTGQLIYTVAGALLHKDVLWIIREIPYASLDSPYGHGDLFDFVHRLNYVVEKPVFFLVTIGLVGLLAGAFRQPGRFTSVEVMLVAATFLVFFVAHSFFWWKGIFNSMGLPRVLIGVIPLIVLLALQGLSYIEKAFRKIGTFVVAGALILVVIYPFTFRSQGVVYNKDLFRVPENELIAEEVAPFVKENFPDFEGRRLYYSHPFVSMALNHDFFDSEKHASMNELHAGGVRQGALVIWDYWFSAMEAGVSWEQVSRDPRLKLVKEFTGYDGVKPLRFAVFEEAGN